LTAATRKPFGITDHKPYRSRKLIENVRALLPDSGQTVDS
jgi:hypothetical protein